MRERGVGARGRGSGRPRQPRTLVCRSSWSRAQTSPYGTHGAVRLGDQVQIHPVRYVQGLAAAVAGGGSRVFERTRALGVEEGGPCRVRTAQGEVQADHVVVATHYPFLDRGLYFARLKAQRSVLHRRPPGERRAAPDGMSISAGTPTRSLRSYGDLLIVGGEGHATGSGGQARALRAPRGVRARHWDVEAITHRWSAHDPSPYDHLPVIGPYRPGSRACGSPRDS